MRRKENLIFPLILLAFCLISSICQEDSSKRSEQEELIWEIPSEFHITEYMKSLSRKEILDTLNHRLNYHLGSYNQLEARWKNKSVSIYSKRTYNRDEVVFSISHKDALTSEIDISRFDFPDKSEEFLDLHKRATNIRFTNSLDDPSFRLPENVLSLIHATFYHLANMPYSYLRDDLIGLSTTLKTPMFKMLKEEIEILDMDLQKYVYSNRKQIKATYDFYMKTLKAAFSLSDLRKIFPRSDLSFNDFLFAADIANRHSSSGYYQNILQLYIIPIYIYLSPTDPVQNYKERSPMALRKTDNLQNKISNYRSDFQTMEGLQPGEEITAWFGGYTNKEYFLRFGYIPEVNSNECSMIGNMFEKGKYLEFLNFPGNSFP